VRFSGLQDGHEERRAGDVHVAYTLSIPMYARIGGETILQADHGRIRRCALHFVRFVVVSTELHRAWIPAEQHNHEPHVGQMQPGMHEIE
jgi:hypothetical protein